jgi:TolB protein
MRLIGACVAGIAAFVLVQAGGAERADGAFSGANGRIVVQVTARGGFGPANLWVFHPDKGGVVRLTRDNAHNANPAWSPDGRRIAFNSDRLGIGEADHDLWLVDSDASNLRRLTLGPAIDTDPAWAPDGRRIAFESDRAGNIEIWSLDTSSGSEPARLTTSPGEDADPAWSPDGSRIAFLSTRDGNREIYVMNADGSNQTRLTASPGADRHPSWSPDGRYIAFDSERNGNFEIYLMEADGSDERRMTLNPAVDSRPAFSPDGRHIVFQSERGARGARQIFRIPLAGGAIERSVWLYVQWATSADWQRRPSGETCDITGTIHNDQIELYAGRSRETICGLAGNDRLDGGVADDVLHGGPGNDLLFAYSGDRDRLFGGPGNDYLYVRDSNRRIGPDFADGGPGRDRAVADRVDRIRNTEKVSRPKR